MVHVIKALRAEGRPIRDISRGLSISRNTVRKYIGLGEAELVERLDHPRRRHRLDEHRAALGQLVVAHPKWSSIRIRRALEERVGAVDLCPRSFRQYVAALKEGLPREPGRRFAPVLDLLAGEQCQVDGGEERVVIGGEARKVYFVVFVLSFSRMMHVCVSPRPVRTEEYIRMHDEAFRAFGGMTRECVYDQARLVVVSEEFREIVANESFARYAASAGFAIHACEGYDPQSKGRVESGVKYVKNDFLREESFASFGELGERLGRWLAEVAGERIHGTTRQRPRELFEREERAALRPYLAPSVEELHRAPQGDLRQADKTSLISWRGNRFSVPTAWQEKQVLVRVEGTGRLHICDPASGDLLAEFPIPAGRGEVLRNSNHYRDPKVRIAALEHEIRGRCGEEVGGRLLELIRGTSPRIYKDQIAGLLKVLKSVPPTMDPGAVLAELASRQSLTTSFVRDSIAAWLARPGRQPERPSPPDAATARGLLAYAALAIAPEAGP